MKVKTCISLIIIVIILLGNSNVDVKAQTYTNHKVEYHISENFETKVIHKINLFHNDKYTGINRILVEETTSDINNILVNKNNINYKIKNDKNKVEIIFNETLLGPVEKFIVYEYKTKKIIKKTGSLYSINVPKVKGNLINSYELKIYLPKFLNTPQYNSKINSDEIGKYLLFNKNDLLSYGKYINFGEAVYYLLSVKHLISNEKNYIVVPPNIPNRQQVFVNYISKVPTKIYNDFDGNTFYEYNSKNNIEGVSAEYIIKIYGNASPQILEDYSLYTKPIKNWNYTAGILPNTLEKVKKSTNKVEAAFNSTITYLDYNENKNNFNTASRVGAENLNENNSKNAICLEYSDLFIALLRGAGIPAREINGFSYTGDITNYINPQLHSWVEYNLSNNWVQADPTWSDTSNEDYLAGFDLFHIAFLRRSQNSEFPLLTGSYYKNNISEELKIMAINKPNKRKLQLKVVDLFFLKFVINDNLEKIANIEPKNAVFVSTKNYESIKDYNNDFFKIEIKKASYKDFFTLNKNLFIVGIICISVSVSLFVIMHLQLKKIAPQKKHKVSRII